MSHAASCRTLNVLLVLAAVVMSGCSSTRATFAGESPERVWSAMVAAAYDPLYLVPDSEMPWTLRENRVFVDELEPRLEIYRRLQRVDFLTSTETTLEEREHRFQILFDPDDPPQAAFHSRSLLAPGRVTEEAERYFEDVTARLESGDMIPLAYVPPRPLGAPVWPVSAVDDVPAMSADTTVSLAPPVLVPPARDFMPGEDGVHQDGGAISPEHAVRSLLSGMFTNNPDVIRQVALDDPRLDLLWSGPPASALPEEARRQLETASLERAAVGDTLVRGTRSVRVDETMVNADRQLVVARVAGETLAPFVVVRTGTGWRVDPRPIIERRTLR